VGERGRDLRGEVLRGFCGEMDFAARGLRGIADSCKSITSCCCFFCCFFFSESSVIFARGCFADWGRKGRGLRRRGGSKSLGKN